MQLRGNKKVWSGRAWFRRFVDRDGGATSSEYGTILAVVIITVVVSITTLGGKVSTTVSNVGAELFSAAGAGGDDSSGDTADGGGKGNGQGRGAGQGGGKGSGRGGGGRSQGKERG